MGEVAMEPVELVAKEPWWLWNPSLFQLFLPLKTPSRGEVILVQTYSPCYPKSYEKSVVFLRGKYFDRNWQPRLWPPALVEGAWRRNRRAGFFGSSFKPSYRRVGTPGTNHLYSWYGLAKNWLCVLQTPSKNKQNQTTKKPNKTCQEQ